jgi:hypothetical protein
LGVPLMLAKCFLFQRQVQRTALCLFFFFEQFLPISVYMADARAQELPLLTVGDWRSLQSRKTSADRRAQ